MDGLIGGSHGELDLAELEQSVRIVLVEIGGFRTFLALPLLTEGKVIGRIVAARTKVQPFTGEKAIELAQQVIQRQTTQEKLAAEFKTIMAGEKDKIVYATGYAPAAAPAAKPGAAIPAKPGAVVAPAPAPAAAAAPAPAAAPTP